MPVRPCGHWERPKYYYGDKIKENDLVGSCSKHEREVKVKLSLCFN